MWDNSLWDYETSVQRETGGISIMIYLKRSLVLLRNAAAAKKEVNM